MRKLSAFFLITASVACAAIATQACSSDGGAEAQPEQDASVDATTDAAPAEETPDSTVTPPKDSSPSSNKPTDGGIDLDALGPDEYALQVNGCAAFAACGGAIDGKSYKYTGGCFDEDALENAIATTAGCPIDVSNSVAVVKGTLEFKAESQMERTLGLRVSADVLVPGSCGVLLLGGCASLGESAASFGIGGLKCYDEVGGNGCDCLLNTTTPQQTTAGTYSVNGGNTLVLPTGDGGTSNAPFCVDTTTLRHKDVGDRASALDPGAFMTWKLDEQAP